MKVRQTIIHKPISCATQSKLSRQPLRSFDTDFPNSTSTSKHPFQNQLINLLFKKVYNTLPLKRMPIRNFDGNNKQFMTFTKLVISKLRQKYCSNSISTSRRLATIDFEENHPHYGIYLQHIVKGKSIPIEREWLGSAIYDNSPAYKTTHNFRALLGSSKSDNKIHRTYKFTLPNEDIRKLLNKGKTSKIGASKISCSTDRKHIEHYRISAPKIIKSGTPYSITNTMSIDRRKYMLAKQISFDVTELKPW